MENRKELSRQKRHRRIKLRMFGTSQRPRLVVHRSIRNLSAQILDDVQNKVIFCLKQKSPSAGNIKEAQVFGETFSQKAKEKGITRVVFDRAGYLYHGRIKAFADALRKGGLEF